MSKPGASEIEESLNGLNNKLDSVFEQVAQGGDAEMLGDYMEKASSDMVGLAENSSDNLDAMVSKMFQLKTDVKTYENAEPTKLQKLDFFFDELKEKGFGFTTKGQDIMGQRWKRWIKNKKNADEVQKYQVLTCDSLKLEFRKNWAKGRWAEHQELHGG